MLPQPSPPRLGLRIAALLGVAWLAHGVSRSLMTAEELADADSCSLLQRDQGSELNHAVRRSPSKPAVMAKAKKAEATLNATGRCLKFLHIPRTGGTSISSLNMHQSSPVFDSLMLRTYQKIAAHMVSADYASKYGSSLGRMHDESRRDVMHYMTHFMPVHYSDYNFVVQPDGGSCEDYHTPPHDSLEVNNFLREGSCAVFCAVREPLQRFISAYETWDMGPCDPEGFESNVRSLLPAIQKQPSKNVCMFTPQVQFVFGATNKSLATKQYCQHILHTEQLNDEFDAFMKDRGEKLSLPKAKMMGETPYTACRVDLGKVTQAAKQLIFEHYRADYDAFGYPRP